MQSQVSKILKHLDISHNDNEGLLQNDNAFSLVKQINEYMIKETVKEKEQTDKQQALEAGKQRIQDLLVVKDDRLLVDSKRFCIYFDDLQKRY